MVYAKNVKSATKNANNIQILATLYELYIFFWNLERNNTKEEKGAKNQVGEKPNPQKRSFRHIHYRCRRFRCVGRVGHAMGTSPTCSLARDNCTFHTQISWPLSAQPRVFRDFKTMGQVTFVTFAAIPSAITGMQVVQDASVTKFRVRLKSHHKTRKGRVLTLWSPGKRASSSRWRPIGYLPEW